MKNFISAFEKRLTNLGKGSFNNKQITDD